MTYSLMLTHLWISFSLSITESEKKVLQAAAIVQKNTGCPVIIHPGRSPAAPEEILRIIQESGAKADQIVISHLDRKFNP